MAKIFGPKNEILGPKKRSHDRKNERFFVRPKSGFWPKNGFYPKKSPKMTFPPLIIWAKALFFFEQLFPVVARTWLGQKSGTLFWAQNFGFWSKNPIFAIQPQFWSMTHF